MTEAWSGRPQAYLGIAYPKFPNLFALLGPNTGPGHNSIIVMIECQMKYIIQLLSYMYKNGKRSCEVKETAFQRFYRTCYKRLKETTFDSGCKSW